MIVKAKLRKWGNSYGVRIPKKMVEAEGLKEGEEVEVSVGKETNVLRETFGTFKSDDKRSTAEILKEMDRELYPEDYEDE